MREAGRMVANAHQRVKLAIAPGVTTAELDELVRACIVEQGGELVFKGYKGFPGHICASINEEIVHGVPSNRPLLAGDIIAIDIGVRYRRYIGDSAWTYPVGEVDDESRALLAAGEEALARGIAAAQPGAKLSALGYAVQGYAEGLGYGVVRDYTGHGVGTEMHEKPQVPNYVDPKRVMGQDLVIKPGLVIAIEPMINAGTYETDIVRVPAELNQSGSVGLSGKKMWEVVITRDRRRSVHFEHTVAITASGPQILTLP
jgi:methionyl aminopeptidase